MEFNNQEVANNIKDLIYQINSDYSRRAVFRKYIFQFHGEWKKKDKKIDSLEYGKYIWGSKVLVPSKCKIEDVFRDNLLVQVVRFFHEKGKYYISEINEDDLMNLVLFANIGYIKFNTVLHTLFLTPYKDGEKITNESINPSELPDNNIEIKGLEEPEEVLIEVDNSNEDDDLFREIINFSESLKQQINNGHNLILEMELAYKEINIQLLEKEEENQLLKIEIEEIKEEKEKEIENLKLQLVDIKKEREEDKKILTEFKNMKRIIDTIKGLFAKEGSF